MVKYTSDGKVVVEPTTKKFKPKSVRKSTPKVQESRFRKEGAPERVGIIATVGVILFALAVSIPNF